VRCLCPPPLREVYVSHCGHRGVWPCANSNGVMRGTSVATRGPDDYLATWAWFRAKYRQIPRESPALAQPAWSQLLSAPRSSLRFATKGAFAGGPFQVDI
jgi:hypothetical protein